MKERLEFSRKKISIPKTWIAEEQQGHKEQRQGNYHFGDVTFLSCWEFGGVREKWRHTSEGEKATRLKKLPSVNQEDLTQCL